MADLKVVPNELDGWDVVRADEDVALTNHPTREDAEQAARIRRTRSARTPRAR
jgi:hypothetical protein